MSSQSDNKGYFGDYGGRFVPELLIPNLLELESTYQLLRNNKDFERELSYYLTQYAGRPTPLYYAKKLSAYYDHKAKIYLKREDLCHTGAHKINNTLGQALIAKYMAKQRVIAETGAGQHGVATATAAALFDLECDIYMGKEDMERQALNVFRMNLLGARVLPVLTGSMTLKDATNEAMRDWATNIKTTHYIIGSVVGPHPYPTIVRDFQTIIGEETAKQVSAVEGRIPDYLVACVGGGSNSIGLFHPFYDNPEVKMVGVEAAGKSIQTGLHAATLTAGNPGVFHGSKSYLLQNEDGQVKIAHSVAAGLDYPGVGPQHSFYKDTGRASYVSVTDDEAISAFCLLSRLEGIVPALESAHAIAYLRYLIPGLKGGEIIVICLSGRGDKDVEHVNRILQTSHQLKET